MNDTSGGESSLEAYRSGTTGTKARAGTPAPGREVRPHLAFSHGSLPGPWLNLYGKEYRHLPMAIHTSYTDARANLASLCDEATDNRETVIIRRRGREDIALIAASELASLTETTYLLSSPANAARLLRALKRARKGARKSQTVDVLRRKIGMESPRK
jgi:antitoxin YefM